MTPEEILEKENIYYMKTKDELEEEKPSKMMYSCY